MGQGDRLASGDKSAIFGPPTQYNLDRPLTDEPGAFTCKCGKPFSTASAFVDHVHEAHDDAAKSVAEVRERSGKTNMVDPSESMLWNMCRAIADYVTKDNREAAIKLLRGYIEAA